MGLKGAFNLVKDSFQAWSQDKATRLAAALSYFAIFSLAPLLIVAITIAGLVLGEQQTQEQVVGLLAEQVGEEGAEQLRTMIAGANQMVEATGLLPTIIALGATVLGASGLFGQLQDALNTVWGVRIKPGLGIVATIRQRAFLLLLVFATGLLLLVLLIANTAVAGVTALLANQLPAPNWVWQLVAILVTVAVISGIVAVIFKYVPMVEVSWRDVWVGAIVTGVLLTIGQIAIGFYLGRTSYSSIYGAAGSIVLLLVWIFYSAQVFFFGAEFTQIYSNRYGSGMRPSDQAVRIRDSDQGTQAPEDDYVAGKDEKDEEDEETAEKDEQAR